MAIPNDLRQINRRRIVLAMLRLGTASRTQLARATGLSQPTAGKIVDDLLTTGVLCHDTTAVPADPDAGRTGRPAQLLQLNADRSRFLAVQLGVRNTRMALLSVAPPMTDDWPIKFRTPNTASKWVAAVARAAATLSRTEPEAILVSAPGVLDESVGRLLLSPNLPWAKGIDLPALLKPVSGGAPVHTMQEIRSLALGQRAAEPEVEDFLLVDFGTGIGSTAVVGGSLYRGPLPMIGEIGHTPVVGNRRPCACGGVGCLETLVSRAAIVRAVLGEGRKEAAPDDLARDWGTAIDAVNAHGLTPALREALDAAGAVIAGALNALGLDRVVLTGGLAALPSVALDQLASAIRAGTMWARFGQVHVSFAPRHRLAGLASMAIDRVIAPPG